MEHRAAALASMGMSAAVVDHVVMGRSTTQSLDLLLATASDSTSTSNSDSLSASISTARSFGAPTSLLVALSGTRQASDKPRPDLSAAATTVQRAFRAYTIRTQLKRAIESKYHTLVRDEDELQLDADAEMAHLLVLIEDAREREEDVELDELQKAHIELELLRTEEALAEAQWVIKFGDIVRSEADDLSSAKREQAARMIQLAYRAMVERQSHEYDSDEFELDSSDAEDVEEEIEEEIEEGVASWAIDDVYVGREPQGVAGASMLLESVNVSLSFVALAVLVAAAHGGALGMSITALLSEGSRQ